MTVGKKSGSGEDRTDERQRNHGQNTQSEKSRSRLFVSFGPEAVADYFLDKNDAERRAQHFSTI